MVQTTSRVDFPGINEADAPISATAPLRADISKSRYISRKWMEQEWEKLWTKSWLFAGLAADLSQPGDFINVEIGMESVIVVRDADNCLRAIYNACQHRGNRIVTQYNGNARHLRCPYHGWAYALDGALKGVPSRKRFTPEPGPDTHSLKRVNVESLGGLVWINMSDDPQPLAQFLGVLPQLLAPYNLQRMVLVSHQSVALDTNWKTVRDNFLEQYHVDFIHPQHAHTVDCENSENTLFPYGHSMTRVKGFVTDEKYVVPEEVPHYLAPLLQGLKINGDDFKGRVAELREVVQKQKRSIAAELGFDYGQLSDSEITDVIQLDIFPNLFLTVQAEEISIYTPRPEGKDPDKCLFDKLTLQVPRELAADDEKGISLSPSLVGSVNDPRPEPDFFDQRAVVDEEKSLSLTFDQDIFYLPAMQAGMHSRGFEKLTLNIDEARIQHFHDWLDSTLQASGSPASSASK